MNIELVYTRYFIKAAQKLPHTQQDKLADLLEIFKMKPFAPILHTKQLTGKLTGFYSFRITRDYRVIFEFISPAEIKLIDVAHRREIYQ